MRFNLKALEEMTHEKDGSVKSPTLTPSARRQGGTTKHVFLGFLREVLYLQGTARWGQSE